MQEDHYFVEQSGSFNDFYMPSIINVRIILLKDCRHFIEKIASELPAHEQAHARLYRSGQDRENFVIARTLIRRVCADYSGLHPSAVPLRVTPLGRPYVGRDGWTREGIVEFNITHSDECVVLAWAEDERVGVDVELVKSGPGANLEEIARLSFSQNEYDVLTSVKAEEAAAVFYRIWVRKEAIVKAIGCGICGPLSNFSVVNCGPNHSIWPATIILPSINQSFSVHDFVPAAGHIASVAAPQGAVVHYSRAMLFQNAPSGDDDLGSEGWSAPPVGSSTGSQTP